MARHPVLTDALLDAALGPEAEPDPKARSPRFFHRPLYERLTRAHPASPYLLWAGPIAACLAFGTAAHDPPRLLLLLAVGWLVWTFVEYWLHRGFFHLAPTTPARRVTSFIVHRHHHVAPNDRDRLVATPLYSGGLALLLLGLYGLIAGPDARWPLLAGTLLGYLAYERAHHLAHHGRPRTALGRALRRRHLRHHFADRGLDFGISSPLWDLVFRTYSKRHAPEDRPDRPCPP
ncbi:sterol desaturase family protein [Nannocystis bainbridge]|uniref:Sterol desaturase family protein n=1 Tax=Nannocystis bainbridge TaxID=2995303 RepID=A0ABT5EBM6_9BACT|nr:sterol desaturase family protein [Nannocystis bainbridge]MDC0723277.1 sterol desaturase family protein [Nannocystis bainbridge]